MQTDPFCLPLICGYSWRYIKIYVITNDVRGTWVNLQSVSIKRHLLGITLTDGTGKKKWDRSCLVYVQIFLSQRVFVAGAIFGDPAFHRKIVKKTCSHLLVLVYFLSNDLTECCVMINREHCLLILPLNRKPILRQMKWKRKICLCFALLTARQSLRHSHLMPSTPAREAWCYTHQRPHPAPSMSPFSWHHKI